MHSWTRRVRSAEDGAKKRVVFQIRVQFFAGVIDVEELGADAVLAIVHGGAEDDGEKDHRALRLAVGRDDVLPAERDGFGVGEADAVGGEILTQNGKRFTHMVAKHGRNVHRGAQLNALAGAKLGVIEARIQGREHLVNVFGS